MLVGRFTTGVSLKSAAILAADFSNLSIYIIAQFENFCKPPAAACPKPSRGTLLDNCELIRKKLKPSRQRKGVWTSADYKLSARGPVGGKPGGYQRGNIIAAVVAYHNVSYQHNARGNQKNNRPNKPAGVVIIFWGGVVGCHKIFLFLFVN
jgi:hypothetical protein